MEKKILVLDFDGTITDAEEEGKPYIQGYSDDLSLLLGKKPEELAPILQEVAAEIMSHPDENGWRYNGLIVAPALVDPYLRMQAVSRRIFDRFEVFAQHPDRENLLNFLYSSNYSLTGTSFRAGASQVLKELCSAEDLALYIVTNSDTKNVSRKILALSDGDATLAALCRQVMGGAKKFIVDSRPEHLEESMSLPGLSRPIYLRRSAYYDVLNGLRLDNGVDWSAVTVIGDIFELDLALPFALGARTGLVVNQFTPEYERNFISRNPEQTTLIESLEQVLPFVFG